MRRFLLLFLTGLIAVLAILAAGAYYFLQNESWVKNRLTAYALRTTGRPLLIEGPLSIDLGRTTRVEAHQVRYPNAAWAADKDMISIGHLQFSIDIASLFDTTPLLPQLLLEDCAVHLESNAQGEANWRVFPPRERPPEAAEQPVRPLAVLLDGQISNCAYTQDGPGRKSPLQVQVDQFSLKLKDGQQWDGSGSGSVNGEALSLSGQLNPPGALIAGKPLQYDLAVRVGKVDLHSKGSIQNPHTGAGSDLTVRFTGPEIARVIEYLHLPPLSSGPFDFRLDLDNHGQMTGLTIDGDLGSLKVAAKGDVDRLRKPTEGKVSFSATGPNLQALGSAVGVDGLVEDSFESEGEVSFKPGTVNFSRLTLDTPTDHVDLRGTLGTSSGFAGSDLDVKLSAEQLGRWAPLLQRPQRDFGAITAQGRLKTDASGVATLQASFEHLRNALTVDGQLGAVKEGFHPKLQIDFHSDDVSPLVGLLADHAMPAAPTAVRGQVEWHDQKLTLEQISINLDDHKSSVNGVIDVNEGFVGSQLSFDLDSPDLSRLGQLFGRGGLPAAPLKAKGAIAKPGAMYRLQQVHLDLEQHEATVDGLLNAQPGLAGSDLQVTLKSPDITALGRLFGGSGKLVAPLELTGTLKPDGKGLEFRIDDGQIGGSGHIRVQGKMPDLQHPTLMDADFDIQVPSLAPFSVFAPSLTWPEVTGSARGHLSNEGSHSRLQDVHVEAGALQANLTGDVYLEGRFDLEIQLHGDNAGELGDWLHQPLPSQPFNLAGQVSGDASALQLVGLTAVLGSSHGGGDLDITLGQRARIQGKLSFPLLDLSWLETERVEERKEAEGGRSFVFDDTRVMKITDIGFDVDAHVAVSELQLVNTRLRDVDVGILLSGPRVEIKPFSLKGPSGGELSGHASLDNRGEKPIFNFQLKGQNIALGLAVGKGQDMSTYPHADVEIELDGRGVTRREMASGIDGRIRVNLGSGQIARSRAEFLLSDFATQLLSQLNPVNENSDYTQVDCAVAGALIKDGQMNVLPLVAQTEQVTILSQGTIDLRTEGVDLSFNSKPRKGLGITASTLINPFIKVGGTLAQPAVVLDPTGAVVGGGTAVATMGLSVIAKGFTDRFLASKDPCGDARKEIAKQDADSQ